jgi:hypothetical protein
MHPSENHAKLNIKVHTLINALVTLLMSPVRIDPHECVFWHMLMNLQSRFRTRLQMLLPRKSLHCNALRVALTTDPMSADEQLVQLATAPLHPCAGSPKTGFERIQVTM